MIAVGYVGYNTYFRGGLDFRFPPQVRELMRPFNPKVDGWFEQVQKVKCYLDDSDHHPYSLTCEETTRPLMVLWGDSHAMALLPGLVELNKQFPFGLMVLGASQCPPILDVEPYLFRKQCVDFTNKNVNLILKLKPNVLLINFAYREPRYFWDLNYFEEHFINTINFIKKNSPATKMIVVGPVPRWDDGPQSKVLRKWIRNPLRDSILPTKLPATHLTEYDDLVKALAPQLGYEYISAWQAFCDPEGCLTRIGNQYKDFVALDYGHLSQAGSEYFINQIQETLLTQLGIQAKSLPKAK